MKRLYSAINHRLSELKKAITQAEKVKSSLQIKGHLRISYSNGIPRCYHVGETDKRNGQYISKGKQDLARALAQKDYTDHFLTEARSELDVLEQTLTWLSANNAGRVFSDLSPYRKELVSPYIPDDEEYAKEWQERAFRTNRFMVEEKKYDTRRGEKVRSKSEAILADMFNSLNIPYRYEPELKLKNGATRYPDFALLKIKTRETFYLEHLGLLDDDEYRNNSLSKLDEYRANGIFPGKNLLITYETAECPLDIKGIRSMIKYLFEDAG